MAHNHLRAELQVMIQARYEPIFDLQRRHLKGLPNISDSTRARWDEEHLNQFVQSETDSLLQVVVRVREEHGETGPLTEDQYHRASMQRAHATIAWAQAGMSEAAEREADPRKKEVLTLLAADAKASMAELQRLHDPETLTDELLDEVTSKIAGRMNKFNDRIKPPEDPGT